MTDDKDKTEPTANTGDDTVRKEENADIEKRQEALHELVSVDMPPAAAGEIIDADKRLDQVSETEKNLEDGD